VGSKNGDHCNQIVALCFHQHACQTPFEIKATPKGAYAVDITYRPAECKDLEDVERVVQEAGNEFRARHGRPPWPAPPPIAFPKFCLAEDPTGLWVAEHGDTIVGFGFSWMTEKFWFLSQLFVRPQTQAKGVGQALLSKTLMQAQRNGATNRALITPAYNITSTGLYLNNDLYPREPLYRIVLAAADALGVMGAKQALAEIGLAINLITGPCTDTPTLRERTQALCCWCRPAHPARSWPFNVNCAPPMRLA
jgi:GNAT superfamily N-acetyltransferase